VLFIADFIVLADFIFIILTEVSLALTFDS